MPARPAQRLLYIDWLRGLAVLFMFEAHVVSAWIAVEERHQPTFGWLSIIGGYAAPLFLFLTGVGLALSLESALGRGVEREAARRAARKRGWLILVAAYVFRVQEHILGGGPVGNLFRVDILNCIGVCMVLCTTLGWPRDRGRWAWRALVAALVVGALSPLVGKIHWPHGTPWPLTSYIADSRSWFFPLFPWAAYPFAGLAAGTLWARSSRPGGRPGRVMLGTFVAGALLVVAAALYLGFPSAKLLMLGGKWRNAPTYIMAHLGWICVAAALLWGAQRWFHPARFGPLRQLGRTSLLMYWVHVDLVYGHLPGEHVLGIKGSLTIGEALVGLAFLTLLLLPVSWARTHYLGALKPAGLFEKLWRDFVGSLRAAWQRSAERRQPTAEKPDISPQVGGEGGSPQADTASSSLPAEAGEGALARPSSDAETAAAGSGRRSRG